MEPCDASRGASDQRFAKRSAAMLSIGRSRGFSLVGSGDFPLNGPNHQPIGFNLDNPHGLSRFDDHAFARGVQRLAVHADDPAGQHPAFRPAQPTNQTLELTPLVLVGQHVLSTRGIEQYLAAKIGMRPPAKTQGNQAWNADHHGGGHRQADARARPEAEQNGPSNAEPEKNARMPAVGKKISSKARPNPSASNKMGQIQISMASSALLRHLRRPELQRRSILPTDSCRNH